MGRGILKNFWVQLTSVIIAIVLWFYVNGEKPRSIVLNIALVPVSVPSGMSVKEIVPNRVKVTMRGKFNELLTLNARAIKLNLSRVGISSINRGDTEVFREISARDVSVSSNIEVVKIEPSRAAVKIGKLQTR